MKLERVRLRCIKRHLDRDDVIDFENGKISVEDIKVISYGDEVMGFTDFNNEYFEHISTEHRLNDFHRAVNNWSMIDIPLSEIERFFKKP